MTDNYSTRENQIKKKLQQAPFYSEIIDQSKSFM